MIVDTSALIAAARGESDSERIIAAIIKGGAVPAPVVLEFRRVVTAGGSRRAPQAEAFLDDLLQNELRIEPFTSTDADLASAANFEYGAGNGRGGRLNLLDLMVYATAKRLKQPILCTGSDFPATDATIHSASRPS